MRILVTGATGFIGARLLSRLAVECDELVILRRKSSGTEQTKNIRFAEVIGDVSNYGDVLRAVQGCDHVFHVAASVSYDERLKWLQHETNVVGTRNVVRACLEAGIKRLVYTSSVVAIGADEEGGLANEDSPYNLGRYNISYCDTKHEAEDEVRKGVERGLDAVIVNPGAVFGPGDMRRYKGHLYGGRAWVHIFYVGGGISTVDVDDVVEGHIRAWKKGRTGERYILAGQNLTFKEISETIGGVMGWPRPRVKLPTWFVFMVARLATVASRLFGIKPVATVPMAKFTRLNLFFSNEKAKLELGMQFRPLKESIERAVDWFKGKGL